jgi:electron transfer flavoprotein beta subunit
MKAKKKEIETIPVESLLKAEPRTAVASFHPPAKKGRGTVLEGDVKEMADRLVGILREKTTVLR